LSFGLIIAGWALAVIAASTLVWHRRREQAAQCAWARDHGLTIYSGRPRDLAHRLRGLTLMQVGHSRRIEAAFVTPKGDIAFCYHCQTGFEQNRYLHRWLVAAVRMPEGEGDQGGSPNGRAVVTAQDWLAAASHSTTGRVLPVGPALDTATAATRPGSQSDPRASLATPSQGPAERSSGRIALVEDADAWRPRLDGEIGRWLQGQPATRNWEIVPGWVIGYEPGHAEGEALLSLSAATKELASRLGS